MTTETKTALQASLVFPAADTKILVLLADQPDRSTNALRKSLCMNLRYVTQRCQAMEQEGLIVGQRRVIRYEDETDIEIVWSLSPTLPDALARVATQWSPITPSKAQQTAAAEREQMQP